MLIECNQFLFKLLQKQFFLSNLTVLFQLSLIPESFLFICITTELVLLSYNKLTIKHLERLVSFNNFAYTTN